MTSLQLRPCSIIVMTAPSCPYALRNRLRVASMSWLACTEFACAECGVTPACFVIPLLYHTPGGIAETPGHHPGPARERRRAPKVTDLPKFTRRHSDASPLQGRISIAAADFSRPCKTPWKSEKTSSSTSRHRQGAPTVLPSSPPAYTVGGMVLAWLCSASERSRVPREQRAIT